MTTVNADPNTFLADDYEPGDRFAFEIQPDAVYEIVGRTELPGELISLTAHLVNEHGPHVEYTFTFPATQPVSARRRIRTVLVPCVICKEYGKHQSDTAYFLVSGGMCGKH